MLKTSCARHHGPISLAPVFLKAHFSTTLSHRSKLSSLPRTINQLVSSPSPNPQNGTVVNGWIQAISRKKKVAFVRVSDGTTGRFLQVVDSGRKFTDGLHIGSSVRFVGDLVESPGSGQDLELQVTGLEILGHHDDEFYPIAPRAEGFPDDILRDFAHLRIRSAEGMALARIRDSLARAFHDFFEDNDFLHITTPILTSSDCEGAGETFDVSAAGPTLTPPTSSSTTPFTRDKGFFSVPTHLTVSSQLHLECITSAISRTYTLSPTFRAEPSNTSRHLAEFWMLEAEVSFTSNLDQVMDVVEQGIKSVLRRVLRPGSRSRADLELFWKACEEWIPDIGMSLEDCAKEDKAWHRITYSHAIEILTTQLRQQPHFFQYDPKEGIQTEHEKWLAGEYFKAPVFITKYPASQKPFYMKPSPPSSTSETTVENFDLIVPRYGELAGGSLREEEAGPLIKAMQDRKMDVDKYSWYLDLRRFGTVPHGGFGMGWERLVCWITGLKNIKESIPFPRWKGNCKF